jgi:hypothetical protein
VHLADVLIDSHGALLGSGERDAGIHLAHPSLGRVHLLKHLPQLSCGGTSGDLLQDVLGEEATM